MTMSSSAGSQPLTLPAARIIRRQRARGQSLVEFAVVVPMLFLLIGGIAQLGVVIAAQHQLTQIGRDVGRWAATQTVDPCSAGATAAKTQADELATQSGLFGYTAGDFAASGVDVTWSIDPPGTRCPPVDNTDVAWVDVELSHAVPAFVPGFSDFTLTTSARFRMEPPPAP